MAKNNGGGEADAGYMGGYDPDLGLGAKGYEAARHGTQSQPTHAHRAGSGKGPTAPIAGPRTHIGGSTQPISGGASSSNIG